MLKSPLYFGAVHYPKAFTIHTLNYALGLAASAEAAGARIFEETPAIEIDPAGVRKRIVTPTARVRATHIVLAGNVHIGRRHVEASRARCCRFRPMSSRRRRWASSCVK